MTTTPHPFRFGIYATATTGDVWPGKVRQIEELGYSTLLVTDHPAVGGLAPIAALAAAAGATRSLRIGAHVFANDFRHPALLAQEAASLDQLSGGRLELGLGTGYARGDYDQL